MKWTIRVFTLAFILSQGINFFSLRAQTDTGISPETPLIANVSWKRLTVFPSSVKLKGIRDREQVVVVGENSKNKTQDLTRIAKYSSLNPDIATVDGRGLVHGLRNGPGKIKVQIGSQSITVPVLVSQTEVDNPINFTKEIVPVLTKEGCNQGACHGSQHGKGGFRLSLRGFDPGFDYEQIVQSSKGRRVVLSDPERSIFLLKPTLTMEHGGGERFPVNSP